MPKNIKNNKLFLVQFVLNAGNIVLVTVTYLFVSSRLISMCAFNFNQLFLLLSSFLICTVHFHNRIENRSLLRFVETFRHQIKIVIFSITLWILSLWILELKMLSLYVIASIGLISFVLMMIWFLVVRRILLYFRKKGKNNLNVIIIGTDRMALDLYERSISYAPNGYNFGGFFIAEDCNVDNLVDIDKSLIKGSVKDIIPYLKKKHIHEIYFAVPICEKIKKVIEYAENNMIRSNFLLDLQIPSSRTYGLRVCNGIPIVSLHDEPLSNAINRAKKRIFDIVFSLLFLCIVFPILYIVLGSIIKLTSEGPIFFKQKRTGLDGKDFYCWKFRTMCLSEDADTKQACKGDSRITRIGAFMRKTNLDEMPQFINVLKGEMSVVGPRPHMLAHTTEYGERINCYMVRHFVKPGITGWAQVNGFRGETKHLSEMYGRVEKDIWYIENWSFNLDLKIIFMTIFNMLKGEKNAY